MALEIKRYEDLLALDGKLTVENTQSLQQHFKDFLNEVDEIILSLDNVTSMDRSSAFNLEQLYLDFMRSNRSIVIISRENRDIAEIMKSTKTSYILSDDRI